MICLPCRKDSHQGCPEFARQASDPPLTATERAASALCDCQHKPRVAANG